ncbi:MAG: hypothetical protein LUG27_09750 [Clostridiales bacterium]|nr:hypothetical protein [Clostridiales bacterium]
MRRKRSLALLLCMALPLGLCACQSDSGETGSSSSEAADSDTQAYIEEALNLANNENQEWTYSSSADAWVLSSVSAVAYPEIEDEQGVSVCVPGAYVTGIDTDGDGTADVTSADASDAVNGSLVIDYDAEITSTNGQVYTAATAPVILNTGAAGYSEQSNSNASTSYAAEGYINVSCGNRGKQSSITDDDGNTVYTGDAPCCLVDQKNATRYVKYNILLGNLPGSVDYFVSTGGSGGGAHATMFAATSNNSDFYDYEIEAGAVGVYYTEDGGYTTTVTIDGTDYEISDGAWGCIAYSAITSLYEADMALAFEYYLDTDYSFSTDFQAQLAEYLSESYMEYINEQELTVDESAVGFDINEDGDTDDTVELTIEYDLEAYPETNGYYGTYLNFYLAEFTQNLQWYLDNLDYADGWTWFDADGNALSDEEVAAMTTEDKATAFIEGRYTKGSSGSDAMGGGMDGGMPDGDMGGGMPGGDMDTSELPDGDMDTSELPDGDVDLSDIDTSEMGEMPDAADGDMDLSDIDTSELPDMSGMDGETPDDMEIDEDMMVDADDTERGGPGRGNNADDADSAGGEDTEEVGTPDAGTTQSATGSTDSANYDSYEDMVAEYEEDINEILAGDEYGNNIVSLYNPLNYIGSGDTENPTWTRIVMGASEGDMSMFSSLNLQIAWLNAGVDAVIEWQWDGGHVPSEVLGESLSLYVDEMYGEYVDGAAAVEKPEAEAQTENGTSESASGTDLSSWVNYSDTSSVSFTLADAVSYRTAGASKAMPGFDVIDYGQEDYVFGSSDQDARHWNTWLLDIFQTYADVLEPLFNQTD